MAKVSIILGEMGTGKSYSMRNLSIESTYIIEVLPTKELPFRGSDKWINTKHLTFKTDYLSTIKQLRKVANECPKIHTIIIDDAIYIMRNEYFARAMEPGYGRYTELAQHFQMIIDECGKLRDDIRVFLVLHSEPLTDENRTIIGYKASTIGKLIDNQYNPLECVTVVLYSDIQFDADGTAHYGFHTRKRKVGQVLLPCKSPAGMFPADFIDNDLKSVIEFMDKYYSSDDEEEKPVIMRDPVDLNIFEL